MWPFTRLTDYIANSVPRIKAFDLNALQDYIIALFSGTKTVKSVHADGVGDAASTAAAGEVKASGSVRPQKKVFGTSLPTPTVAIDEDTWGEVRTCVFTIATPGDPPTFAGGEAVYSASRTGTGLYEIVWDVVLTELPNNIGCSVNWHASGNTANIITTDSGGPGGRFRTTVGILNAALNLVDQAGRFNVVIHPR